MVSSTNSAVWSALESSLVPPSASTSWYYSTLLKKSVEVICLLPVGLITGSLAGVGAGVAKAGSFALSFFRSPAVANPKYNFSAVVANSKLWDGIGTAEKIEKDLIENPDKMPEPEIEGVGTSTFQDSPHTVPSSQWAVEAWQQRIPEADRPGFHVNLFQLYKTSTGRQELINRLKKLHVTHYRFSVEWSHLEPLEGYWQQEMLTTYVDLCKDLRDAGIAPIVTLLHFSEPLWFHNKGSFENEQNITHFINFSAKVFAQLTLDYKGRPLVEWFCTINEPAVDAFSRYVLGTFSPTGSILKNLWAGRFLNFARAGKFLKNLLKAHVLVYKRLKEQNLPTVKVGIIHQYLKMRSTNPITFLVTRYFTRLVNDVPMNFFKSGGNFDLKVPLLCNIEEECAAPKTDFVGTQYYVRPIIGIMGPTSDGEPMTKMPFHEDPAGIYEAILKTHDAFKAPVLVTETGISTDNPEQRSCFMLRTRYAIREAAHAIGTKNLLGLIWWCLGDNMELERGMTQNFGLYAQTRSGLAEVPKPGVEPSARVAEAWRKRSVVQEQKTA